MLFGRIFDSTSCKTWLKGIGLIGRTDERFADSGDLRIDVEPRDSWYFWIRFMRVLVFSTWDFRVVDER